ncbi:teicoplanin resistance protein VanZ [Staphylococcus sp. 17KM0847]|uniref:TcaA NTF2-like domain-containing protein n=1 Tax=Staphylococcus sp. 17KM0847 TaxID=2583989 RepID=UPI0015DC368B|nr:teicoplanin resistance protein VanZ [Staphylococcus sp. 17KM0847]QLK86716.1 teicoplanin resistance protein VanZ [Staphylococcus sp. 17KM0847]
MKQCPYCKEHIKTKQHCTHCRRQVNSAVEPPNRDEPTHDTTKSIKKLIPLIILSFIIILLTILFLLLKNFNSPESQAKLLVNAVDNDDTSKVATLLSTKNNKVGRKEAGIYIAFIKDKMGMKQFGKKVNQAVSHLDEDRPVSYEVRTDKGQKVLRISKNGRRYLIFDNLSFQAPMKQAILKPNTKATYEFVADGAKKKVMGEQDQPIVLSEFIPGKYTIKATKTTSRGTYNGQLKFDTSSSDHDRVHVKEEFEEAHVKVSLKDSDSLDQDTLKIMINGETFDYKEHEAYGPFPLNKELTISAQGKVQNKVFKTHTQKIKTVEGKENNKVTVKFNDDAIKKYKEAQEKDTLNKITDFIEKYTSALNTAYKDKSMSAITPYILKDTEYYKVMKTRVRNQKAIDDQNVKVTDMNKTDRFYSVIVQTEEEGETKQAHYLLQGDDDGSNLKVVNYEQYE